MDSNRFHGIFFDDVASAIIGQEGGQALGRLMPREKGDKRSRSTSQKGASAVQSTCHAGQRAVRMAQGPWYVTKFWGIRKRHSWQLHTHYMSDESSVPQGEQSFFGAAALSIQVGPVAPPPRVVRKFGPLGVEAGTGGVDVGAVGGVWSLPPRRRWREQHSSASPIDPW